MDMGIEPFLIASSVVFICAQRLCRKICPYCKEAYDIPDSVLERVGVGPGQLRARAVSGFFRGKGCAKCANTGFLGRVGALEAMLIDNEIRAMITRRATADQIKSYAIKHGMKTLKDDAINKFMNGITTLEEALSISSED